MQFGRGSLVAAPDFVGDFLFVVGIKGSCQVPQGSCNININFPELFLDGSHVSSGLQINNVMGVTVSYRRFPPRSSFLDIHASRRPLSGGARRILSQLYSIRTPN